MTDPKKELKKIERQAYALLRQQTKEPGKVSKIKASKEAKAYAKKIQKYRELTGRKRVSAGVKALLHKYTAEKIARPPVLTEKSYKNRVAKFKKTYGESKVTPDILKELHYATPSAVAKANKVDQRKSEQPILIPAVFSEIDMKPVLAWDRIPASVKKWSRKPGYFLYDNFVWASGFEPEHIIYVLSGQGNPWKSKDHTIYDFASQSINFIYPGRKILVNPGKLPNGGAPFYVYEDEWEKAVKLDQNYQNTRIYFKEP